MIAINFCRHYFNDEYVRYDLKFEFIIMKHKYNCLNCFVSFLASQNTMNAIERMLWLVCVCAYLFVL